MNKNITTTVVLSTILASIPTTAHSDDFIKVKVVDPNEITYESVREVSNSTSPNNSPINPDLVLRIGEYPDKPGKRLTLPSNEFDYNNLPIKYDKANDNYYISEYYFNQKIAKALYKYLLDNGVNVILQDTQSKSEDLNSAGRIARRKSPKIYLSIHTNSYQDNSSGYFFMSNQGDTHSSQLAKRLSYSLKDNKLIPMRDNRVNNGYIGELNEKPGTFNILGEFGFFSNPKEAKNLSSDEYINYVAKHMGDELIAILKEISS